MAEYGEMRAAMVEDVRGFMAEAEALGIRLFLEDNRLQCRGPQELLTSDLLARVRERRDEIVAQLRRQAGPDSTGLLTAGQRSLLLHQRLTPDSVSYNLALVFRVDEVLDAVRLDAALRAVMDRHAILRTSFLWNDGEPRSGSVRSPRRFSGRRPRRPSSWRRSPRGSPTSHSISNGTCRCGRHSSGPARMTSVRSWCWCCTTSRRTCAPSV